MAAEDEGHGEGPRPAETWRRLIGWIVLAAAVVPALGWHDTVAQVTRLRPEEGAPVWLVRAQAATLYLWAPVVVTSAFLLFLLPGLFLARALGAARDLMRWLLYGFALSVVTVTPCVAGIEAIVGAPLRGTAFGCVLAALGAVCALIARRTRRGRAPLDRSSLMRQAPWLIVPPLLLQAALTPKIYWECFNGDGAHTFEVARLACRRLVPFWGPEFGPIAGFPGETSMLFVFPMSWATRLFGEVEAAARLPYVLELTLLYAALVAFAQAAARRGLTAGERAAAWGGLGVYTVTMVFSATYNPYFTDMALPATQDTLLTACFLGVVVAALHREHGWMLLLAALTYAAAPSGVMLGALWIGATVLVGRPRPWVGLLLLGAGLAACLVLTRHLPGLLDSLGIPPPGREYESLKSRFRYIVLTDYSRVLFMLLPCGLLPAVTMLRWRHLDGPARALSLVTCGYFAIFYVKEVVALHYFVPAMVLPLAVFWRMRTASEIRPAWTAAYLAAAAIGLAGVWPRHTDIHQTGRRIGETILDARGGYESMEPHAYRTGSVLERLFPSNWEPGVPDERYGGSELVWHHYARRTGSPASFEYVLARRGEPPPEGMEELASLEDVVLYVRDRAALERHRHLKPPARGGSRFLQIPKSRLFRGRRIEGDSSVIDVKRLLERLGLI